MYFEHTEDIIEFEKKNYISIKMVVKERQKERI